MTTLDNKPTVIDYKRGNTLMIIFLFFIFTSSIGETLTAQNSSSDISIFEVPESETFASNIITKIFQDRDGYLWFCKIDGLYRYDGYNSKHFKSGLKNNQHLSHPNVLSIDEDRDDNIIIGTEYGVNIFNKNSNRFSYLYPFNKMDIKTNKINCLKAIDQNRVIIGTDNGLFIAQNYTQDNIHIAKLTNSSKINDISQNLNRELWISTKEGIIYFNPRSNDIFTLKIKYKNQDKVNSFLKLFIDSSRTAWILTDQGLFAIKDFESKFRTGEELILSGVDTIYPNWENNRLTKISSISEDSRGRVWITSDGAGMVIFNIKTGDLNHLKLENSNLSSNYIHCLYEGDEEQIYIGTDSGTHIYNPTQSRFTYETKDPFRNRFSLNHLHEIVEDSKNRLWIGTRGLGLTVLDYSQKKAHHFSRNNGNNIDSIRAIYSDSKDLLWIGAGSGIYRFKNSQLNDIDNWSRKVPFNLPIALKGEYIYSICEDIFSNIWIGTTSGLWIYSRSQDKFTKINRGKLGSQLNGETVYFIEKDSKDNLWIGTVSGKLIQLPVSITDPLQINDINIFSYPSDLTNIPYNICFKETSNGNFFLGTNQGLFSIDTESKEIKPLKSKIVIPEGYIFGIVEDSYNTLWLSSTNGVFRYDYKKDIFEYYSNKDGLISLQFNGGASYIGHDGKVYFGGGKGLSSIMPKPFIKNINNNKISVVGLRINGNIVEPNDGSDILDEPISKLKNISLKSDHRNITLEFSTFKFFTPQKQKFECKLEGYDDKWIALGGENYVTYTNLPSGDYRFIVRVDDINKSSTAETVLNISIPEYWYATTLFKLTVLVLLILITYWFRVARENKRKFKQQLQLAELEKEKSDEVYEAKLRFFTNVSHEIRTPLSLITAPINSLLQDLKEDKRATGKLLIAQRNASRLIRLINEILDFRKMDQNKITLKAQAYNIVTVLEDAFENFNLYAESHKIDLTMRSNLDDIDSQILWFDKDLMEKILFNLIANAINATSPGGKIEIAVGNREILSEDKFSNRLDIIKDRDNSDKIYIKVKDSGKGISQSNMSNIFERFFVGEISTTGTGIGLSLVKNFIDLHSGTIELSSEEGVGSSFIIGFRYGKNHLSSSSIYKNNSEIEKRDENWNLKLGSQSNIVIKEDSKEHTILIVEDNNDLREFLQIELSGNFNVYSAPDGETGYETANSIHPDIIVSDVMMGEMSGFDLCEKIRNNIEISHIPIILLTAKTLDKDHIKGLKVGADLYMTKPFNSDVLKANIDTLLRNKRDQREEFQQKGIFATPEIKINSFDDQLLEKMNALITENICDPDYTINEFADELNLSRAQFFRKIKALTGDTPNNIIKTTRINMAKKLLQESNLPISEIAYKVGFNDPKYFAKCFKAQLGYNPSSPEARKK